MKKYQFDETTKNALEKLRVPLAVYQFINRRVLTVLLSDGFCDLIGMKDREEALYMMDHNMYETAHPDDKARVADEAIRFAAMGDKYDVVYRTRPYGSDEYRILHAVGERVITDDGVQLVYIWYTDEGVYSEESSVQFSMSNALRRSLHEENVINARNYDALTGLPTMSYFYELADQWQLNRDNVESTAVLIYMNLNGMKYYNRRYGFAEGDKLLRRFSEILVKYFGSENCSRLGSDHFGVYTDSADIENILREIFKEFRFDTSVSSLPVRVGIYSEKHGTLGISTECDRAKYACDTMRNSRISGFRYFDDTMLVQMEKRQYYIDNLNKAIGEKWIQVYYQPVIRAANGRVCDEEALARWIDPVKGVVSPGEFIPVLEEAKLIYKLDLYVMEQVLEKIKIQAAEGLYVVPISVNLSRSDFDACDIVDEIRRRVDASGISRSKINIEVTESTVGKDLEYMKVQIERFRNMGFHVWMDDFGSGYSSLDMLHSIPFDLIKFDMRFMKQFAESDKSRIMLTELVRMAISLGIDTVCEGVETKEQVDFLHEIGCTMMQGYYYCSPIPMERVLERYRRGIQIGFEDPDESEYFAAIGKINLYDLAIISNEDQEAFEQYFNTIPMGILEVNAESFMLVRCNSSYRKFLMKQLGTVPIGKPVSFEKGDGVTSRGFLNALHDCAEQGGKTLVNDKLPDKSVIHTIIKCISVNPVTGKRAVVIAVLAVTTADKSPLTFTNIAKAFFSDYYSMFYVDINSERFIEYSSDSNLGELTMERHGDDFFATIHSEAQTIVYNEDIDAFIKDFNKKNVLGSIEQEGDYVLSFRRMTDGEPVPVEMKALRVKSDMDHIIIVISKKHRHAKRADAAPRYYLGGGDR